MKEVVVLVGAGKHIVLGDLKLKAAKATAKLFTYQSVNFYSFDDDLM